MPGRRSRGRGRGRSRGRGHPAPSVDYEVVASSAEMSGETPVAGQPTDDLEQAAVQGQAEPAASSSASHGEPAASSSAGHAEVSASDPALSPFVMIRPLESFDQGYPSHPSEVESQVSEPRLVIDEEAESAASTLVEVDEESDDEFDKMVAEAEGQRRDPDFDPAASPSKRPRVVVVPVPARKVTTPGTHHLAPLPGRLVRPIRPPASVQPPSGAAASSSRPFTRSRGAVEPDEPVPSTSFAHLSDDDDESAEEPSAGASELVVLDPPPAEQEKRRRSGLPPEVRAAQKDAAAIRQQAFAVGDQTAVRVMAYVSTLINGWGAALLSSTRAQRVQNNKRSQLLSLF